MSAHKIGGPKGVGALYIRKGTKLAPLIHGGGHERGCARGPRTSRARSASPLAAELAVREQEEETPRLASLRERLEAGLSERVPGPRGERRRRAERLPNILNVSVPGANTETLLVTLDLEGIAVSSGSACSSGAVTPSHVLTDDGGPGRDRRPLHPLLAGPRDHLDEEIDRRDPPPSRRSCERMRALARIRCDVDPWKATRMRRTEKTYGLVAMSGGVDSSVAAALLVEQGHRVIGVTMKTFCYSESEGPSQTCCGLDGIMDARRVADRLGIPHYVFDVERDFTRDVIDDFVAEYAAGRTPNPCVRCNGNTKFRDLLQRGRDARLRRHRHRPLRADGSDEPATPVLLRGRRPAKGPGVLPLGPARRSCCRS